MLGRAVGRRPASRTFVAGVIAALALALGGLVAPTEPAAALSRWTGGIDLYRSGVFTTQKTWLWCTAADVQIIRNIARHQADHSRTNQERYFDWMRAHDRYRIPVTDGTDPGGWAAGLAHFVDARYRLVVSGSFDAALRSAVTNLRRTNLPVGITVAHGDHAWVLTGFTATADPATTSRFTVTSVRVVGPLWGLQSRSYGYDMAPDTRLTPRQLAGFFTPWHYARVRMAWEGRWVSIQPIEARSVKPAPNPTPKPTVRATPKPSAAAPTASSPTPSEVAPSAAVSTEPSAAPVEVAAAAPVASAASSGATAGQSGADGASAADSASPVGGYLAVVAVSIVLAAAIIARGLSRRRRT
jgi:hypothetical protein